MSVRCRQRAVAEGVGFEPTEACTSAVFKTTAFVHSATPPERNLSVGWNRPAGPRVGGCGGWVANVLRTADHAVSGPAVSATVSATVSAHR